ncbi:MAG TPA: hypothetical protein ENK67_05510 [Flavobacteriia bacterium]|jgi:hypothetical protein|nr:hypothetical protein [Flavobacteriia bacterium]
MKTFILYLFIGMIGILSLSCQNSKSTETSNLATNIDQNTSPKLKRYSLKSGIVKYKSKINGKVMGSTITGNGTEEVYFKDWGAKELKKSDEKKVTHINIFGQKKTEVSETHTIDKLDNGKSYNVDLKNKVIYVQKDPALAMVKTFGNGDVEASGKKMLESMGGKQVGKEKILGYNCDVWEIPGGKQWIYKGIPLKLQMTVMGVTTTKEATDAKFNVDVPEKYFNLPDYPIQELDTGGMSLSDEDAQIDPKDLDMIKKMSFEDYKKMLQQDDPEAYKQMSPNDLKMSYQLMQKMAQQMGQ